MRSATSDSAVRRSDRDDGAERVHDQELSIDPSGSRLGQRPQRHCEPALMDRAPEQQDPQGWAGRERNRRQRVGVDSGADGEEPADTGLVDRREHGVDEVDGVALDLLGRGPVAPPQHRHRELPRHAARSPDGADVTVDDHGGARLVVAHGDEDRFERGVECGRPCRWTATPDRRGQEHRDPGR